MPKGKRIMSIHPDFRDYMDRVRNKMRTESGFEIPYTQLTKLLATKLNEEGDFINFIRGQTGRRKRRQIILEL